jgi:hypothetical protein
LIVPLLDGYVAVLNVNLNKFWRRSPNWIWADVSSQADALANNNCQFDIVKLSSTKVAFRSIANDHLLKRYSEFWENMLCATGSTVNDPTCHLDVHEAVLSRRLTDIRCVNPSLTSNLEPRTSNHEYLFSFLLFSYIFFFSISRSLALFRP